MIVHLIDGTYELFRQFYGLRRLSKGEERPFAAGNGVLHSVLQMIETGSTHIGVATDHVIESFRTPDKDLAQCVRGDRVVQVDRRANQVRDAAAIVEKFGVEPVLIPDFLALVGDAADGFPGIPRIGRVTAARLLNQHGPIESFPDSVLGERRELALLFKDLATLRTDAPLFDDVDELRWVGPTPDFENQAARLGDDRLVERCRKARGGLGRAG